MKIRSLLAAANVAGLILVAQNFAVAAEIKVLSAGGIRPPLLELASQFERASAHKVTLKFTGVPVLKRELDAGGAVDVVIASAGLMDELAKEGKIAPATRADLARAGVGVGVRSGAPKPDIGSVDAFRRALLNAKSVAYAKDGAAGTHFVGVLERLGISKEMQPKLKPTVAADIANGTMALLARGEAEIGVAAIASVFAPGVDFVGPLPAELQSYVQFTAGVSTSAREPKAAAELIKFVTAPAAAAAYKAKGMEAAGHRH